MKTLINDFKSVIINGDADADDVQKARIFLLLFIPLMVLVLLFGHPSKF